MISTLDDYPPLKRDNRYELKFNTKSLVTPVISRPAAVKIILFKNFIKSKDPETKQIFYNMYKNYN